MRLYPLCIIVLCYCVVIGSTQETNLTAEWSIDMEEVIQQAKQLGLDARAHLVLTADGATLSVVRTGRVDGPPVLLAHGLLQTAAAWLDAGPASLAALLAPKYDLWLLNARGSTLSRPPPNIEQWQFCADDMGRYDLPALIDYILTHSGKSQLSYIGYSQGASTLFIMCSELPDYCDKVNIMMALAPAARISGMKSTLKYVFDYYERNEKLLNNFGVYEVMPKGGVLSELQLKVCKGSLSVCELIKDIYDGPNKGSIDPFTYLTAALSFPSGTSVRNMARYGQHIKNRSFQKYDYGSEQNLIRYGNKTVPVYDLSAVTVPTVLIYSKTDRLVDVSNIKWLLRRLPRVVEAYEIKDPSWTHMDFTMSRNIPKYIYPTVKKYLHKYNEGIRS